MPTSSLQSILYHLNEIQPLCSELEPLLPDASPHSRWLASVIRTQMSSIQDAIEETLGAYTEESPNASQESHASWQVPQSTLSWAQEKRTNEAEQLNESEDENVVGRGEEEAELLQTAQEAGDGPEPTQDAHLDAKQAEIARRAEDILKSLDADLPTVDDVGLLLMGRLQKCKVAVREDQAFGRLLCGLPRASIHDWSELLGDLAEGISTTTAIVVHSTAHDDIASVEERLVTRHRAITSADMGNAATSILMFILLQIEAIKFASDWQARHATPGGKKAISAFYHRAFMREPAYAGHFTGLTELGASKRLEELQDDYKPWRNATGHIITARNRLLRLFCTFGPAVLLDPTWAVEGLVRGRSRLFVPVWDHVVSRVDMRTLPSRSHAARTVVRIMTVLGGENVGAHVEGFLEEFAVNGEGGV